MPVLSRFCGITIKMYFRQSEHNPPHIHATYQDEVGLFSLEDGDMFEGDMQVKHQQKIKAFIKKYSENLFYMWETQQFNNLPYED